MIENHASLENETVGFFAIKKELKKAIKEAKDDLKWTEELILSRRLLKAQVRQVIKSFFFLTAFSCILNL